MVFVGLDNAGKTTLLGVLKDGRLRSSKPTILPSMQLDLFLRCLSSAESKCTTDQEEIKLGLLTLHTADLGGHKPARQVWRDYLVDVGRRKLMLY